MTVDAIVEVGAGVGEGGVDCETPLVGVTMTVDAIVEVGAGVGEGAGSPPHAASEMMAARDDRTIAETRMRPTVFIAFDRGTPASS